MTTSHHYWSYRERSWLQIVQQLNSKTGEYIEIGYVPVSDYVFFTVCMTIMTVVGGTSALINWPYFLVVITCTALLTKRFVIPFIQNKKKEFYFQRLLKDKATVRLNAETFDELLWDDTIRGKLVGFTTPAGYPPYGKLIIREDGLPMSFAFMVFENPEDQVLFMIKHGIN